MYSQAKKLAIMVSRVKESFLKGGFFIADLNIITTNRCNLKCPMCNSGLPASERRIDFSLSAFRKYASILSDLRIPICSISGGEPTLVRDLPSIIEEATKLFPVEVVLFSNFYADSLAFESAIQSALRNNARIVCSFDGFGPTGDYLRGGNNVSDQVLKNIKMTSRMKTSLKSSSILEIHTVLSDQNLSQIEEILAVSQNCGWYHTIAPVNHFYYMDDSNDPPRLTYGDELKKALAAILNTRNVKQMPSFTKGILEYSRGTFKKNCPYARGSRINKFKIFLEASGDVSLCDRVPLGNLNDTPIREIFEGKAYQAYLDRNSKCHGCWMSCFTEPMLAVRPSNYGEVLHRL